MMNNLITRLVLATMFLVCGIAGMIIVPVLTLLCVFASLFGVIESSPKELWLKVNSPL